MTLQSRNADQTPPSALPKVPRFTRVPLISALLAVLSLIMSVLPLLLPETLPAWLAWVQSEAFSISAITASVLSFLTLLFSSAYAIATRLDVLRDGYASMSAAYQDNATAIRSATDIAIASGNVRRSRTYAYDIPHRVLQARSVRNTFVGMEDLDFKIIDAETLYTRYFEKNPNGTWTDAIGISDASSQRYRKLRPHARFSVHLLKHNPPIINFMILEHENEDAEVFFGWLGSPNPGKRQLRSGEVKVYHSSDPVIVDLFRDYFNVMIDTYGWANRRGPHLELAEAERGLDGSEQTSRLVSMEHDDPFVPKVGWWITSFRYTISGKPRLRAFVRFDFNYTSRKDLHDSQVFIIDSSGTFFTYAAHGETIAHTKNELHFRWRQMEPLPNDPSRLEEGSGFCTYVFDRNRKVSAFVVSEDDNRRGLLSGRRMTAAEARPLEQRFASMRTNNACEKDLTPDDRRFFEDTMKAFIHPAEDPDTEASGKDAPPAAVDTATDALPSRGSDAP